MKDQQDKDRQDVGADQLFDAIRWIWVGESPDSTCHGVEVRHFDSTTESFLFPNGPIRNVWGLVNAAQALGEGWQDTSSSKGFDHLLSHGH